MAQFDKMRRGFAFAEREDKMSKGESISPAMCSDPTVTVTSPACIYCGNPADLHSENFPYCSRACGVLAESQE